MATFDSAKVQEIFDDASLDRQTKIDRLRDFETEARGRQRAATESAMDASDGWQDDLREVRKALAALGAKKLRKGAATL